MPIIIGNPVLGVRSRTAPLKIKGSPDVLNFRYLSIRGPMASSGNFPVFVAAPPSDTIPLWIGRHTYSASGNTTLWVRSDGGSSALPSIPEAAVGEDLVVALSNSGHQAFAPLVFPFVTNSGTNANISLHVGVDLVGSGITTMPVFTSGTSVAFNSNTTLVASGGTTGAPGSLNDNAPLFVGANAIHSGVMNLTMAKDFNTSQNISLAIYSRSPSGLAPLSVSGKLVSNNNISLNIGNTLDPSGNTVPLRVKGYLE